MIAYPDIDQSIAEDLLFELVGQSHLVITIPNDPTLDSFAAGWGLFDLLAPLLRVPAELRCRRIPLDSPVRRTIDLLHPAIELGRLPSTASEWSVALIGASLDDGNPLPAKLRHRVVAVIDTRLGRPPIQLPFWDVRPSVASISSIVASYFVSLAREPSPKVATAMYLAIRSQGNLVESNQTHLDARMADWLESLVEADLLEELSSYLEQPTLAASSRVGPAS